MCCPATCRTAQVEALPKRAAEAMGQVDILVNNAGITRDQLFMRMSDADWEAVLDVNLTSDLPAVPGRAARHDEGALGADRQHQLDRRRDTGNPGQANYAAAKAGVVACRRALAAEVASRNITVNCVAPGFITTAMTDKLNDEQKARC
jgi:3-oxoacyl-[acyl-carrier protein] reductase